ncbi:MAG: AAA family ATPase [Clostridia bacterium]|nr:AAA family ATPase [Clostridia bacterium]
MSNTASEIFQRIWEIASSGVAIAIYVVVFALILLWIVISLMNKDSKSSSVIIAGDLSKASDDDTTEAEALKELEDEGSGRFCKLCNLDQMKGSIESGSYDEYITLRQFCENFRNYAASKLKLYYDISDIRRFVSGMAVSKILILQGMSGTGKTSLAHAFGDFVDNPSTVIPVQPMWKERTDLIGYYNEFTKRFNETTLLEKMYEANYSNDIYVTVMDEMNIARVEYYFAEFLSLLELPNAEERLLTVVSDVWEDDPVQLENGCIKLPPNMWFVGTANNDDSTFAISDKVYDRAMIMNLDMKAEPFVAPRTSNTRISAKQFEELAEAAMREYEVSARNLHRIEELDKYLIEHFQITFGNRIMKQIKSYIPVYVACGGDELEALDDILSKKVLRKLEMQNPIYLRSASAGLSAYLDELFGYDRMPLCKAFMARLQRTI